MDTEHNRFGFGKQKAEWEGQCSFWQMSSSERLRDSFKIRTSPPERWGVIQPAVHRKQINWLESTKIRRGNNAAMLKWSNLVPALVHVECIPLLEQSREIIVHRSVLFTPTNKPTPAQSPSNYVPLTKHLNTYSKFFGFMFSNIQQSTDQEKSHAELFCNGFKSEQV